MATATLNKPAAKGGSFLLESPAPADVFTPADLTDDQKLIGQTAEEFVTKEVMPLVKDLENKKPGLMAELVRKGAEVGLMSGGVPEEYGGGGTGQDCDDRADGKTVDLRRVCGDARGACGNRDAADRVFRDRGTEEKIFAEAGDCGN